MAQCTFADGVANVRGTIRKDVRYRDGKKIITSVVASVRGGKQRLYVREYKERRTPLTEKERIIRTQFKAASVYWCSLTDEQKQRFREEWLRSSFRFNGKKYATLRGYVIARFFAGVLPG